MLTLSLTIEETNLILHLLGTQPFNDVSALIIKIKNQGDQQFTEQQAANALALERLNAANRFTPEPVVESDSKAHE